MYKFFFKKIIYIIYIIYTIYLSQLISVVRRGGSITFKSSCIPWYKEKKSI